MVGVEKFSADHTNVIRETVLAVQGVAPLGLLPQFGVTSQRVGIVVLLVIGCHEISEAQLVDDAFNRTSYLKHGCDVIAKINLRLDKVEAS